MPDLDGLPRYVGLIYFSLFPYHPRLALLHGERREDIITTFPAGSEDVGTFFSQVCEDFCGIRTDGIRGSL